MNAQMQQGTFTHGKCNKCGYMALLDKFEQNKIVMGNSTGEDGMTLEMYQLILKCPMCGDEFCEALFANEVN